jgi:hypothetical protein
MYLVDGTYAIAIEVLYNSLFFLFSVRQYRQQQSYSTLALATEIITEFVRSLASMALISSLAER